MRKAYIKPRAGRRPRFPLNAKSALTGVRLVDLDAHQQYWQRQVLRGDVLLCDSTGKGLTTLRAALKAAQAPAKKTKKKGDK
jgi:hypothetical protein